MQASQKPRILFFGTRSLFSQVALETLLAYSFDVVGVVVPGVGSRGLRPLTPLQVVSDLPMIPSFAEPNVVESAWRRDLPVWEAGTVDTGVLDLVKELAVDAVVVACWPSRFPDALLDLPRWGCLNVHPSLLPEYRGPAPLFWQLRDGLRNVGVTIHRMTARMDEGPIFAQEAVRLPEGALSDTVDRLCAGVGGNLLGSVIEALRSGEATPIEQPPGGSYQPWPAEGDFKVPLHWSARQAWNFMRGTSDWDVPYTILLESGNLRVSYPISFDAQATLGDQEYVVEEGVISVQFAEGVLRVPYNEMFREQI